MGVTIREMQIGDYEQVWEMWMQSKNMGFNDRDDSREGIDRLLRRNPGLSFVAEEEGKIAGVILAGQDGRRGYIYHTVVSADCQRQGIGGMLLEAVEAALRAEGIGKVYVPTDAGYAPAEAFWGGHGFIERSELVFRSKALR